MKKIIIPVVLAFSLLVGIISPAVTFGATGSVKVTLPKFKVTFNGVTVDNTSRQYPLIVYKDITYFPMTYYDSRFLGLESDWAQSTGLKIEKTNVTAAYRPYKGNSKNASSYTATVPTFAISVNGTKVDNATEQYPLLSFRDVTYFPLTWKYGVDAFGWNYNFDNKNGLVIQSQNPKVDQIYLPAERGKDYEGKVSSAVAAAKGYVYYEGTKGKINQMSIAEPSKVKTAYQLPIYSYGDGTTYVYPSLSVKKGEVRLSYHQGGATMGNDYLFQLNADGTTTELNSNRTNLLTVGDKTFSWWVGPTPGPGNLSMKEGNGEYKVIGDPDYIYGWEWFRDMEEGSQGGSGSDCAVLIGDELYILAFDYMSTGAEVNGVYKVNIKNNATTRVSGRDKEVMYFEQEGDYIYYSSGKSIYKTSIHNGQEQGILTLSGNEVPIFSAVLNGQVYYTKEADKNLYKVGDVNSLNPGASLLDAKHIGDNSEYLACTFEETATSKYRIMVIGKSGTILFKSSDATVSNSISGEGTALYYYNPSTLTMCKATLLG